MTSIFDENGHNIPVTVIEIEPCVITQVKTEETDGYNAVQLATVDKKEKSTTKALQGHFAKANAKPKRHVKEVRDYIPEGMNPGDTLNISDVLEENTLVDVVGVTKGKGFQGVVKRHGFSGVGEKTHGQKDQERASGSIGQMQDPGRVFKGKKMAGRTGNDQVKVKNLQVMKVMGDSNLLVVKGAVPGPKGRVVEVYNR